MIDGERGVTDAGRGAVEAAMREAAPHALAGLLRHTGDFDQSEDAVQEALLAATVQWPRDGIPDNPSAWLFAVARRRLTDEWRSERARRAREERYHGREVAAAEAVSEVDDTLTLLLLCCHPSLTPASQVALTLRAVGGLTTAEIAAAFLLPEATVAQRISRAKATIRDAGATFAPVPVSSASRGSPADDAVGGRLAPVLQVLYLIHNEGHTASSGEALLRVDLTAEAIRLTRALHRRLPDDGEVAGLLALLLLTDSHRDARVDDAGRLVPLEEQDRTRWDRAQIAEGVALVTAALAASAPGPYQLQAAIAAVHAEAGRAEDTDWAQIVGLYRLLGVVAPGPLVALNEAAAIGMLRGPEAGLARLEPLAADPRLATGHRLAAVRAHLLERAGRTDEAGVAFLEAARRAPTEPERRYLAAKAASCRRAGPDGER